MRIDLLSLLVFSLISALPACNGEGDSDSDTSDGPFTPVFDQSATCS